MVLKARIVKNKKGKYEVYVDDKGKEIPVALAVCEEPPIFDIVEWNTYEGAKTWVNSNNGKLELLEE